MIRPNDGQKPIPPLYFRCFSILVSYHSSYVTVKYPPKFLPFCLLATDVQWPIAAAYYATWVLADALHRAFTDGYNPLVDGSIIHQYIVRTKFVYVYW